MPTECMESYVHMLEILVTKYGIPENINCCVHIYSIVINRSIYMKKFFTTSNNYKNNC